MPFYTIRPRAGTKMHNGNNQIWFLKEREIGYEIPNEGVRAGTLK